jgi:hypothetical protein
VSRALAAVAMATVAWAAADTARASDRELQVVLDRLGCSPGRVVPMELSKSVTLYEVTCRGSGRVVQVACLESECWPQVAPRNEDAPDEREERR